MKFMETTLIRHLVDYQYTIEKRGRKWLVGLLHRANKKPLRDKILINAVSSEWAVGDVRRMIALHEDEPNDFGHKVRIIPIGELSV